MRGETRARRSRISAWPSSRRADARPRTARCAAFSFCGSGANCSLISSQQSRRSLRLWPAHTSGDGHGPAAALHLADAADRRWPATRSACGAAPAATRPPGAVAGWRPAARGSTAGPPPRVPSCAGSPVEAAAAAGAAAALDSSAGRSMETLGKSQSGRTQAILAGRQAAGQRHAGGSARPGGAPAHNQSAMPASTIGMHNHCPMLRPSESSPR